MSTTITYKGSTITTVDNETKKLDTAGTWLEDDITVTDVGVDVSDTTATTSDVADGKYFYNANGQKVEGTASIGIAKIVDTPHLAGGTIRQIDVVNSVTLQNQKTVTLTQQNQTITPDEGYDGFKSLNVTSSDVREDLTIPKDVDFVDFDGRLLYSYTAQEFLALTEMPANPTYPGLSPQGWNWTLADAKEYVSQYEALVIGQNYTTYDGKTRIYISIPQYYIDRINGKFEVIVGGSYNFNIDWGDGSALQQKTATNTSGIHNYSLAGDYVITIEMLSEDAMIGRNASWISIVPDQYRMQNLITKIEIGDNITTFGRQPFRRLYNCQSISIPKTLTNFSAPGTAPDGATFCCGKMRGIVFASGTVGKNVNLMGNGSDNPMLTYISVPKTMTNFYIGTYYRQLRKLTLPPLSSGAYIYLYDVHMLTHFIAPGSYTSCRADMCRNTLMRKLIIPATVTSILATAFAYNGYLQQIHLLPETPPTLSNTNAFSSQTSATNTCIFYVPYSSDHSILNAYKTASNWSTFADKMQEQPQT